MKVESKRAKREEKNLFNQNTNKRPLQFLFTLDSETFSSNCSAACNEDLSQAQRFPHF